MIRVWLLAIAVAFAACGDDDDTTGDDAQMPAMACEPNGNFCDETQYCMKSTGFCLGPGSCLARPATCTGQADGPVCGCDGQTYTNECEAHLAGTSLDSEGACE